MNLSKKHGEPGRQLDTKVPLTGFTAAFWVFEAERRILRQELFLRQSQLKDHPFPAIIH